MKAPYNVDIPEALDRLSIESGNMISKPWYTGQDTKDKFSQAEGCQSQSQAHTLKNISLMESETSVK